MATKTVACSSCGAPIQASRFARSAVCTFCGVTVFIDPDAVERRRFRDALAQWDDPATHGFAQGDLVRIGGRTWALRGRLARGRSTDVYAATLARWPTERAIVKLLREGVDRGRLDREHAALVQLQRSTVKGSERMSLRLPQPIAKGVVEGGTHDGRPALVLRWASGFFDSLATVRHVHRGGVDPRAAVWMWRRTLETLSFAHRTGLAHGAVVPARLLVHPREHGVMMVGWSEAREATVATIGDDVAASARAIAFVVEGATVPDRLATIIGEVAHGGATHGTAWALRERVGTIAEACFGPPRFIPFTMPGW